MCNDGDATDAKEVKRVGTKMSKETPESFLWMGPSSVSLDFRCKDSKHLTVRPTEAYYSGVSVGILVRTPPWLQCTHVMVFFTMPNDKQSCRHEAAPNEPTGRSMQFDGDCLTTTFISFTPPIFELVALVLLRFVCIRVTARC